MIKLVSLRQPELPPLAFSINGSEAANYIFHFDDFFLRGKDTEILFKIKCSL